MVGRLATYHFAPTERNRENLGEPLENSCRVIDTLTRSNNDLDVIYPVHMNLAVRETVFRILEKTANIRLIEPVNVLDIHN